MSKPILNPNIGPMTVFVFGLVAAIVLVGSLVFVGLKAAGLL